MDVLLFKDCFSYWICFSFYYFVNQQPTELAWDEGGQTVVVGLLPNAKCYTDKFNELMSCAVVFIPMGGNIYDSLYTRT